MIDEKREHYNEHKHNTIRIKTLTNGETIKTMDIKNITKAEEIQGEEGLFNIPDSLYHKSCGISKSSLDPINKSPLHYKYAREQEMVETAAMTFGSLCHLIALEPEALDDSIAYGPDCERRSKADKATWIDWWADTEGKIRLTHDGFLVAKDEKGTIKKDSTLSIARAKNIVKSVMEHPLAKDYMTRPGVNEVAIFSKDQETNILKRGKIDRLCVESGCIVDLKTTSDSSVKGFMKSIFGFNYHAQASYYLDMANEQGLDVNKFIFVVVEKVRPYSVSVFEIDAYSIAAGRKQYRKNLKLLSKCIDSDFWPSHNDNKLIVTEKPSWIEC